MISECSLHEQGQLTRYSVRAMQWTTDKPSFDCQPVRNLVITSKASGPALEPTMPAIVWMQRLLTPDIKWLERETNHSPPYSVGITYEWSHTSTPTCLNGVDRDSLSLL